MDRYIYTCTLVEQLICTCVNTSSKSQEFQSLEKKALEVGRCLIDAYGAQRPGYNVVDILQLPKLHHILTIGNFWYIPDFYSMRSHVHVDAVAALPPLSRRIPTEASS